MRRIFLKAATTTLVATGLVAALTKAAGVDRTIDLGYSVFGESPIERELRHAIADDEAVRGSIPALDELQAEQLYDNRKLADSVKDLTVVAAERRKTLAELDRSVGFASANGEAVVRFAALPALPVSQWPTFKPAFEAEADADAAIIPQLVQRVGMHAEATLNLSKLIREARAELPISAADIALLKSEVRQAKAADLAGLSARVQQRREKAAALRLKTETLLAKDWRLITLGEVDSVRQRLGRLEMPKAEVAASH